MLLERIISCKYEVLAEYRHNSTVWAVSSLGFWLFKLIFGRKMQLTVCSKEACIIFFKF